MFYVGLDLGKSQDPAAFAVVERRERGRAFQPAIYQDLGVRKLERMALGTPYPQVVERVREVVEHAEVRGQCVLVVDGTGVGAPVVDMLRMARLGCEICAVTITGGERASQNGSAWNVPKRDLIASVQGGAGAGRIADFETDEGRWGSGSGITGYEDDGEEWRQDSVGSGWLRAA